MKKTKFIAGLLACIFSISLLQAQNNKNYSQSPARKLQMAEFAIANLYVDSVDEKRLVEEAIVAMLKDLDPHSTYSNSEEVKKMNEPLVGNFEGIGVQFNMAEDTLFVIQPVSGGPSEKVHSCGSRSRGCRSQYPGCGGFPRRRAVGHPRW